MAEDYEIEYKPDAEYKGFFNPDKPYDKEIDYAQTSDLGQIREEKRNGKENTVRLTR